MNSMRIGKDGKNERNETNFTKMEKANGAFWREKFGSVKLENMVSVQLPAAWLKESLSVIMIEQEHFCGSLRTELCEAKVGRDRH